MGALEEAHAHLRKAEQFLTAAEVNQHLALFDAATSNAVSSGIDAKDAICLKLTGRTNKADRHEDAVKELKAAGTKAAALAQTFERLLALKKKSQYQAAATTGAAATKAVERAHRMYDGAKEIVTS